ncbi:hypothetical protein CAEBREN_15731 [Caenorhabditis brenneri]|uniref:Uncharacterized protein n=1 Tax=Caenorhabditis brenneri TaxID=135651 RepID=G0MYH8_CAEBE|nr:hypothetical protein CAEBREN_15731 [Caenorhabditis brenneri]
MSSETKKKLPTDFSEFHREETERRKKLMEDEENRRNAENWNQEQENVRPPAEPRMLTPEEIDLWRQIEDSDDEEELDEVMEEDDGEEEEKVVEQQLDKDPEHIRDTCRRHITKRLKILKSGIEDEYTEQEFVLLHEFDKLRLQFANEDEIETDELDSLVLDFLKTRIKKCTSEEIVLGYKIVVEMYDSLLGPELYYLSLWEGSPSLLEKERYVLFGV